MELCSKTHTHARTHTYMRTCVQVHPPETDGSILGPHFESLHFDMHTNIHHLSVSFDISTHHAHPTLEGPTCSFPKQVASLCSDVMMSDDVDNYRANKHTHIYIYI